MDVLKFSGIFADPECDNFFKIWTREKNGLARMNVRKASNDRTKRF